MKRNTALWWADLISVIAQGIILLLCFASILIFIHSRIDKVFYNNLIIRLDGSGIYFPFVSASVTIPSSPEKFLLNELTIRSQIILLTLTVVGLVLYFLILIQVRKFLQSIRKMTTFYSENVAVFRKIGFMFLIIFIIKLLPVEISSMEPDGRVITSISHFSFEFKYFIAAVFSFVLSEVFREGEKIRIENEYTI